MTAVSLLAYFGPVFSFYRNIFVLSLLMIILLYSTVNSPFSGGLTLCRKHIPYFKNAYHSTFKWKLHSMPQYCYRMTGRLHLPRSGRALGTQRSRANQHWTGHPTVTPLLIVFFPQFLTLLTALIWIFIAFTGPSNCFYIDCPSPTAWRQKTIYLVA